MNLAYKEGGQATANISIENVIAYDAVDSAWRPEMRQRPDFGLGEVFADGEGCLGDDPNPEKCSLLKRFYGLIDRHEYFYKTYSGLQPDRATVRHRGKATGACSHSPHCSSGAGLRCSPPLPRCSTPR